MFGYLLNAVYLAGIVLASPYLLYVAITKGKYREGFAAKLLGQVPVREGDAPCVWLHAVSVGEVKLLETLVEQLARREPRAVVVISTTTKTGYELARATFAGNTVFYCPLDFTWAMRAAMRRIRPSLLVLSELELWPNLIDQAQRSGARVALINGRLSEKSFRGYRRLNFFFTPLLRKLDCIAVQSELYAERFAQLMGSRESIVVTGSLKFDGALADRHHPRAEVFRELIGLDASDVVFMAGSTQAPEEEYALQAFASLKEEFSCLRLILVPRHPDRFDAVARLLDASGYAWARRSEIEGQGAAVSGNRKTARIVLVDTIGELGSWWALADLAYVGGSMGSREGQNMIEPAALGCAVSFGPRTRNFRDVVALLLDAEAAMVVPDAEALQRFVRTGLENPDRAGELGRRAAVVVHACRGATERTVDQIVPLLPLSAENNDTAAAA